MKRHPGLHDLSHDHHHGLVHAQRLQQAATGSTAMRQAVAAEFLAFWTAHTNHHFREEEEVLLPTCARYASMETPAITQMLREHVLIRRYVGELMEQMERTANADRELPEAATLQAIGITLDAHIRLEERVVFPELEAAVPDEVLAALPAQFRQFEAAEGHTRTNGASVSASAPTLDVE